MSLQNKMDHGLVAFRDAQFDVALDTFSTLEKELLETVKECPPDVAMTCRVLEICRANLMVVRQAMLDEPTWLSHWSCYECHLGRLASSCDPDLRAVAVSVAANALMSSCSKVLEACMEALSEVAAAELPSTDGQALSLDSASAALMFFLVTNERPSNYQQIGRRLIFRRSLKSSSHVASLVPRGLEDAVRLSLCVLTGSPFPTKCFDLTMSCTPVLLAFSKLQAGRDPLCSDREDPKLEDCCKVLLRAFKVVRRPGLGGQRAAIICLKKILRCKTCLPEVRLAAGHVAAFSLRGNSGLFCAAWKLVERAYTTYWARPYSTAGPYSDRLLTAVLRPPPLSLIRYVKAHTLFEDGDSGGSLRAYLEVLQDNFGKQDELWLLRKRVVQECCCVAMLSGNVVVIEQFAAELKRHSDPVSDLFICVLSKEPEALMTFAESLESSVEKDVIGALQAFAARLCEGSQLTRRFARLISSAISRGPARPVVRVLARLCPDLAFFNDENGKESECDLCFLLGIPPSLLGSGDRKVLRESTAMCVRMLEKIACSVHPLSL